MVMLTRKQVILAKLETTYGTDPTPTKELNAILAINPSISEVREPIERNINIASLSNKQSLLGAESFELTFQVELKGSGSVHVAPRLGVLLLACSMAETVTSGTSVAYAPASSSQSSITIYSYIDGRRYILTGARGTFKLTMTAGQIPVLEFTFKGKYNTPSSVAVPAATYDSTEPVPCKSCTFTYNSETTLITSLFELDMANNVIARQSLSDSSGIEGFEITSRKPVASFESEEQVISSYDFRGDQLSTERVVEIDVGAVAGNICTINIPKFNILSIERTDADGISKEKVNGQCAVNSSDDEVTITFT